MVTDMAGLYIRTETKCHNAESETGERSNFPAAQFQPGNPCFTTITAVCLDKSTFHACSPHMVVTSRVLDRWGVKEAGRGGINLIDRVIVSHPGWWAGMVSSWNVWKLRVLDCLEINREGVSVKFISVIRIEHRTTPSRTQTQFLVIEIVFHEINVAERKSNFFYDCEPPN